MYYLIEKYYSNVVVEGEKVTKTKYKITYEGGEFNGVSEYYADDLNEPKTLIRYGYTKHPDSL